MVISYKNKFREKKKNYKDKAKYLRGCGGKFFNWGLQFRRLKGNCFERLQTWKLSVYELNYNHISDILKSFPGNLCGIAQFFPESRALKTPKKVLTIWILALVQPTHLLILSLQYNICSYLKGLDAHPKSLLWRQ